MRHQGFTLVQTVLVLVLLVVIALLAVSRAGDFSKSVLVGVARMACQDAMKIQSDSMAAGDLSGIQFFPGATGNRYVAFAGNPANVKQSPLDPEGLDRGSRPEAIPRREARERDEHGAAARGRF